MTQKRAILFDLDGVITNGWHVNPEKRVYWATTIYEDLGIRPEDLQNFFFTDSFVKEVLTGKKSLVEALTEDLPKCGFKGEASAFIDYWMAHDSNLKQPLLDVVRKLKETGAIRLFVATNNEQFRAEHMWHKMGLKNYFEDIFYAGGFGCLKPELTFYKECERRIGELGSVPPLFFDDSPEYVKGARACGWEAVVFNDLEDCVNHPYIRKFL